jgi:transposase
MKQRTSRSRKHSAIAEIRYRKRSEAVAAVRRREKVAAVARIHGVNIATLFRWLARCRSGGDDAVREGARAGRPRKVDERLLRWLYRAITQGDPPQFQFSFCLWTLGIVRSLLKRRFAIQLSKSGISRLLAHMGLSPQRPIFRSYQQDPRRIEKYLKRAFPQIRRLAKERNAVIYFVDEASVSADEHRGATWGKSGQTPVVQDSGDRFSVNMISAVSPRGDMKFRTFEGRMNEDKYLEFLTDLLHDTCTLIIVIADNASYHSGKFSKKCAKKSDGKVTLFYLPPYAPQLNLDEQVWNHGKARLGKMFIETKGHLVDEVRNVLRSIQMCRDLILSFFQLKDTTYAAAAC